MNEPQPGVYQPPVSALLTLGRPRDKAFSEWPDYVGTYGLSASDVPELIRLFKDETFLDPEPGKRPEPYAFIHAMRALGQLRDEAALNFLLELAETEEDSDWVWEDVPYTIALMGPSVLPRLEASLERTSKEMVIGLTLVTCLEKMAELHPDTRQVCIDILTRRLEHAADNDDGVNGSIISTLIDLKALDSLPVIEKAFATNNVDLMVAGDWDDVQVGFGLKEPDPNKPRLMSPFMQEILNSIEHTAAAKRRAGMERKARRAAENKKKAKRKQARQTRKRNRKRK